MAPQQYTLSFDANGGEGYMAPQSFTAGVEQAIAANAFTREGYYFSAWNTRSDGSGTSYANQENISLSTNTTLYAQWGVTITADVTGNMDGHDYIDLGLPSGLKWATYNVGASTPEAAGKYFAWGETVQKNSYEWSSYAFGTMDNLTKYNVSDGLTVLEASDDAASVLMGGGWRMPTYDEMTELKNNCDWEWVNYNGVNGYMLTGPNGANMFLPTPGYYDGEQLNILGTHGLYWTSTLSSNRLAAAYHLNFGEGEGITIPHGDRFYGRSVRGVYDEEETPEPQFSATVVFDPNGGSGTMANQTFVRGEDQALAANAFTREGYEFVAWNTDKYGHGTSYEDQAVINYDEMFSHSSITLYAQWEFVYAASGEENGQAYVDLGLPSGTKWANYNLGAENTEDAGDYYAWGEIETKSAYTWENYVYGNVSALTKYCQHQEYGLEGYVDNKSQLDAEDDAAYKTWGGKWRVPSDQEMQELIEYCSWTWTSHNETPGYRVTSNINGNSIFLPAAGMKEYAVSMEDSEGYYRTSKRGEEYSYNAFMLLITSNYKGVSERERRLGYSIRPVFSDESPKNVFSVFFHPNGAEGRMEPLLINEGNSITLLSNGFVHSSDYAFTGWNTKADGSGVALSENALFEANFSQWSLNTTLYAQWGTKTADISGNIDGHDYVDLGLPSGLKWATYNVGAAAFEEVGNYYMWGDTKSIDPLGGTHWAKETYYPYHNGDDYIKYVFSEIRTDKKYVLTSSDDAAHVTMGGHWRMPTMDDFNELIYNCTYQRVEYSDKYGASVTGYLFTGPNGKSIFFPNGGCYIDESLGYYGESADYWSSTIAENYNEAWYFVPHEMSYTGNGLITGARTQARPIRAVWSEEAIEEVYTVIYNGNEGYNTYGDYIYWQDFVAGETKALVSILPNEADPLFSREGYTFAGWNTAADGSGTYYGNGQEVTLTSNLKLYAQWRSLSSSPDNSYEYVDLGLSVKWATCNVGANSPEAYGDYFAWGEVDPKESYTWENYKYCNGSSSSLTKYNVDSKFGEVDKKTTLEPLDDAAYINWGGKWRMPTLEEQKELVENCTWTWTSQKGVMGYLVTSNINGNSIFLPASGYCDDVYLDEVDVKGHYWTSTLRSSGGYSDCAYYLLLSSEKQDWNSYDRHYGRTIRAVCE